MWTNEVGPEQVAEIFHRYQEALAPDRAEKTCPSHNSWKEVPDNEKNRLVAAARLALLELESLSKEPPRSRRYFAEPGEAEWGC